MTCPAAEPPRRRPLEPSDDPEQRGLAATGCAQDGSDGSCGHGQVESLSTGRSPKARCSPRYPALWVRARQGGGHLGPPGSDENQCPEQARQAAITMIIAA